MEMEQKWNKLKFLIATLKSENSFDMIEGIFQV